MQKEAMKGMCTIRWTATQRTQEAAAPQGDSARVKPR
jgi:hypothetical protein